MKFVHPEINKVFDFDNGKMNTLVIENPHFLYRLLSDIRNQMNGENGASVLSANDTPLSMSGYADVLDTFVPFDINRKNLITKIISSLEKDAVREDHYEQTMQIMSDIENYLDGLIYDFPCDIVFTKLGISSIIKGAGVELRSEYDSLGEQIIDYFELVTEFDRAKLFITVNLRGYLSDEEVELFSKTAISHGYSVFMIESFSKSRFTSEDRLTIDNDLCEIC